MSTAPGSPRAFTHYQALVMEANRQPLHLCLETDLTDAELWWCDLTPLESWVFGIDPELHNALLYAHIRYQDMIGCSDLEFEEFRAEDRAAFPRFFQGECVYSFEAAVGFMIAACQMPFQQALMWVCRAAVQNVRTGLYGSPHGTPDWALGTVHPDGLYEYPGNWKLVNARGHL